MNKLRSQSQSSGEWFLFIAYLLAMLSVFFYRMLFLGCGYYYGDYKLQHYPWSLELSQAVTRFSLPLWTSKVGCGFPLVAEGQIGALDPINVLIHMIFSPQIAYSMMFLTYFFLGGIFCYAFARKEKLSSVSSALFSTLFLFASAYGGLVYGPAALRTLIWLPIALLFTKNILNKQNMFYSSCLLGCVLGWGVLGGYPQFALYNAIACLIYMMCSAFSKQTKIEAAIVGHFILGLIFSLGFSAAQWVPTLELMSFSNRVGATVDFALGKSFSPAGLSTLFWPGFGVFTACDLYIGVLPLCFAFFAVKKIRVEKQSALYFYFFLIFLAMALGRFNPAYYLFVKYAHLSFLRFPNKWIVYATFALSFLAALGLETMIRGRSDKNTFKTQLYLFLSAFGIFIAAFALARTARDLISNAVSWYVTHFIAGKPGHPFPVENYLSRIEPYLTLITQRTSFSDPLFLWTLFLWALSSLLIYFFIKTNKIKVFIFAGFLLIIADLFIHLPAGTGFYGNCVGSKYIQTDAIANYLSTKKDNYRVYEYMPDAYHPVRWQACSNMLHGYDSAGMYSPLSLKSYTDYMSDLGSVDDSTGTPLITPQKLNNHLNKLRLIGVGYVVSPVKLKLDSLKYLMGNDKEGWLYQLNDIFPRAFVAWDKSISVQTEHVSNGIHLSLSKPSDQMLVITENYYPGWKVSSGDRALKLMPTENNFMSIALTGQEKEVTLSFEPESFFIPFWVSLISFSLLGLFLIIYALKESLT